MSPHTAIEFSRDGGVARLTFNRPDQLNALSPALIDEALAVAESVAQSDARVLVVTGAGKAFSAGVDLKAGQGFDREALRRFSDQARALARLFETMPQIVIARVRGYCFTGGLELALSCDFIVAAADAQFADTHVKLGLTSAWGMTERLSRRIGWMKAKEVCVTARRLGAQEALALGLVLDVLPADQLDARIDRLAADISANSADAVAAYKAQFRLAQNRFLDDGLDAVADAKVRVSDNRERMAAGMAKLAGKS
jgi:enoyl-CoA hydratase/carnithine racemase